MAAIVPAYARHTEWWEHKITLFLFTGLLAIYVAQPLSFWTALGELGITLLAIVICAIFVSVINDFTDLEDDRAAGKTNRLSNMKPAKIRFIIFILLILGAAFCWYYRNQPQTILFYAGSWIAYCAYSFPPIRLKRQGWAGALADAAGAHLFPTLTILSAMSHSLDKPLPAVLYWTAAGWNILFGIRGILWHQYTDLQNDLQAGIKTLATTVSSSVISRIEFPLILLEVISLSFLLWLSGLISLLYLLPAYLTYVWIINLRMKLHPVIILTPEKKEWIFMFSSFYQTILPIGLMLVLSFQSPWYALLIPIHILLFPHDIRANLSIMEDVLRKLLQKKY